MPKSKQVLLVSNGHAEDLAAAMIGAKLKTLAPNAAIKGLALVGLGKAYDKQEIENLGLKRTLPSGGFAKEGFFYFFQDILAGFFGIFSKHIRLLRRLRHETDLVVAVGDAYVVALCGFFLKKPLIFVDGPKSVKIAVYWPIELWLMKKFCKHIIVQDKETDDYLKKLGLPSLYLGSWVMDYVPLTGEKFGLAKETTVIGLLPGTREEAYANLKMILEVLDLMARKKPLLGLIASTLDKEKIKKAIKKTNWSLIDNRKLVSTGGTTALIAEGKFGDVCVRSQLIIGLAGIANEQAVAFGTPVICFPGSGAQTTMRRWKEIHKITGDSMKIVTGTAEEKARQIIDILNDKQLMATMSRIGKES